MYALVSALQFGNVIWSTIVLEFAKTLLKMDRSVTVALQGILFGQNWVKRSPTHAINLAAGLTSKYSSYNGSILQLTCLCTIIIYHKFNSFIRSKVEGRSQYY